MKSGSAIRHITLSAMFIAMSVVIGIFCKSVLNFGNGLFRVTFENLPIILSGVMFGPVTGATVGVLSDIISYLLSGQSYPLNLIVTLGAMSVGLVSGLVSRFWIKKRGTAQIAVSATLAHLVGSMIIKPIGLYQFYGIAVLFRIPLYIAVAAIEILILCLLYKKSGFRRLIDELDREDA